MKNTLHNPDQKIMPPRSDCARIPLRLIGRLNSFRIGSLAVDKSTGEVFGAGDRITGRRVSSRVTMQALGDPETVSRVCALVLLQTGGRSLVGPSKNAGGAWGLVALTPGAVVEVVQ